MNKKLIVLVGISGSGKSTLAHQEWLKDPLNTVVVNRDKIRELLFGFTEETVSEYYGLPNLGALEKQVTLFEDTLIHDGLNLGKTVIADATHLEMKYLEKYRMWNVPTEFWVLDVPIDKAIERDSMRARKVGEEIIRRQFDKLKNLKTIPNLEPVTFEQDITLEPCYLLDLDGTIAHMTNRSPFDWKRVGEDFVDTSVKRISNSILFSHTAKLYICTGRDGSCLDETIQWLDEKGIHYEKIFIRKEGDQRPDWVIKEELWRQIAKDNYIAGLIDDRNQVVRRARALGLKVFQVEYGNF